MGKLPEIVLKAWEARKDPIVFSTTDKDGIPNSIYATCTWIYDPGTIIIADNFFDKTRKNISSGSKGAILFITEEKKSYQIKGSLEYYESGEIFDYMKKMNPARLPGRAVAVFKVEEVFAGSEKLKFDN